MSKILTNTVLPLSGTGEVIRFLLELKGRRYEYYDDVIDQLWQTVIDDTMKGYDNGRIQ